MIKIIHKKSIELGKSGFERVLIWSKYFTKNINQTITANTEDDANIDWTVDSAIKIKQIICASLSELKL